MLDSRRINAMKQELTSCAHDLCGLVGFDNCGRLKLCGRDKLLYVLKIGQDRRWKEETYANYSSNLDFCIAFCSSSRLCSS
jgi:hypothetical protein